MSATILLPDGTTATITRGVWTSADPTLARTLNLSTLPPTGYDPTPDLTAARAAIKRFDATLTHYDRPKHVKGRIY